MQSVKVKICLTLFFLPIAFANLSATTQDELVGATTEKEVDRILQKRDVGELANELADQKPSRNTADLLKRLSIFGRAGHRARVHETLKQLAEADDLKTSTNRYYFTKVVQRAIDSDDFAGQKFYYESIAVGGDERASSFIELWRYSGDVRELENWLAIRARKSDVWWQEWLRLKKDLGTAQTIYDELAQDVRDDPTNWYRIDRYFQTVGNLPDVAWIADVVPTDSSYAAYELGSFLTGRDSTTAIKLFEKSLSLPFTQKDRELFGQRAFRMASIQPKVTNPEKQTRFWTKKALADLYLKTNQPQLAQPLAQDLTTMDASDIQDNDAFMLGGMVQANSGQRVIESKILQDEAQKENSPEYWLERTRYYRGRAENELVWQSYMQALAKFPYEADDWNASVKRLRILESVNSFGASVREGETRDFLSRELTQTVKDARYIFEIARFLDDDFDDLLDEFFVNTNLLPQILDNRSKWRDDERYVISEVMERDVWNEKRREALWNHLSTLAGRDKRNRAFSLAKAMTDQDAYRNAVPLLEECLKIALNGYEGGLNFNREDVQRELFDAYIETGDWRKAEKMYVGGFHYWGNELGKIAVVAAKSGNVTDAVRLWKINANLDRRNFTELKELAKTDAKAPLRDFYMKMKKRDPLTEIPEKALGLL